MKFSLLEPIEFEPKTNCHIAAAILAGGALTAGASVYAASKQNQAANAGIDLQRQMFGEAKDQLQPFINTGQNALAGLTKYIDPNDPSSPLAALLKLTMPGANMTEMLAKTPGYQFAEDRGLRAVNNALAARGVAGSPGAVAKGAADYVTGLSQNTWQSVVQNLLNTFQAGSGAQQNIVNTGANAAGNLAGGAITTGSNQSNTLIQGANAQAAGIMGAANALGGGLSTAGILKNLGGGGGGLYGGGDFGWAMGPGNGYAGPYPSYG